MHPTCVQRHRKHHNHQCHGWPLHGVCTNKKRHGTIDTMDKIYHGHKLWQGGGIVEIIASPMPAKNNCLAYEIHFRDCIEIVDE